MRVYVFDCGKLDGGDPARFSLKREEMAVADMSVACFLVVHPKGTLMWDVGAVPDSAINVPRDADPVPHRAAQRQRAIRDRHPHVEGSTR